MINYDYKCETCGHYFEKRLESKDRKTPESEPCPECGAYTVKKIFLQAPHYSDPVTIGKKKPDGEFSDLLKKIKTENNGSGNIERYT